MEMGYETNGSALSKTTSHATFLNETMKNGDSALLRYLITKAINQQFPDKNQINNTSGQENTCNSTNRLKNLAGTESTTKR
jgi:hypothetical protein